LKPDYPKLSLLVAGSSGWGEEIKSVNGVKLLGFVPDEDLPALYSGAQCFVYPSLYEGFGLPVLEAMASGCPVVTSNVSSLPEVAGAAAVLVNPKSAEEIAEGIKKALKNCQRLSEKGLTQAKRFTWERTAQETLKVYREAASFAYQEAVRC
jgi:glycosyltransferase involved in cell wall biosynthesis